MGDKRYTELVRLVKRCMGFWRWGFKRSYSSSTDIHFPFVIYDSKWCRVKFVHYGGNYARQWSEMNVHYGRLHADNEESVMNWNGEVCWCWHTIERHTLEFLDGLSPKETVEGKEELRVMREYRASKIGKKVSGPEWTARKHRAFWEFYGQRLFELFDLRRPDLWEEYRAFLSEVRVLEDEEDSKSEFQVPKIPDLPEIDQVC